MKLELTRKREQRSTVEGKTVTTAAYAIAILLLLHGAISAAQSLGGGQPVANPAWLSWWPTGLGESWLSSDLLVHSICRLLWLTSGVALLAAGLGLFGVVVPGDSWRALAVVGAAASIPALLLQVHPFYLPVTILNVGIVVGLLWLRWPSVATIGS